MKKIEVHAMCACGEEVTEKDLDSKRELIGAYVHQYTTKIFRTDADFDYAINQILALFEEDRCAERVKKTYRDENGVLRAAEDIIVGEMFMVEDRPAESEKEDLENEIEIRLLYAASGSIEYKNECSYVFSKDDLKRAVNSIADLIEKL